MRESATGRWLRTMATAASLLSLHLAPDEDLYMGGEELRDFYYYFVIPPARVRRNVLAGPLPLEAARAYSGFESAERGHAKYFPALNTLAMGDKNAVSYGQTAHVSLLMSHSDVALSELLTLDSRPPRLAFALTTWSVWRSGSGKPAKTFTLLRLRALLLYWRRCVRATQRLVWSAALPKRSKARLKQHSGVQPSMERQATFGRCPISWTSPALGWRLGPCWT